MGPVQILAKTSPEEIRQELAGIGCDPAGVTVMLPKAIHRLVRITGVPAKAANLLKQEMLAKGGDCAVHRLVCVLGVETSTVLLMGTERQFRALTAKLKSQPFGLKAIGEAVEKAWDRYEGRRPYVLDCRGRKLSVGERTLVMGILNLTPDSFSDGGSYPTVRLAVQRVEEMVAAGADLIDIGAESTRPGFNPVDTETELARLVPFLREILPNCPVPVSIDTYRPETAKQVLELGVHLINDIWGLQPGKDDPGRSPMAAVAAAYGAPVVMMHNQEGTVYRDLMADLLAYFEAGLARAAAAGIPENAVFIDPGIGFGKTVAQNLEVLRRLGEFKVLGKPVLIGTSRKSTIGQVLNLPVTERAEGTLATTAAAIMQGVDVVRVHDVTANVRVARMTEAIVRPDLRK